MKFVRVAEPQNKRETGQSQSSLFGFHLNDRIPREKVQEMLESNSSEFSKDQFMPNCCRRYGLVAILAVLLFGNVAIVHADDPETNRKNVLFIAIDDLRTELGCYGLPYVQSPNLDQLATQSVLFENHFVQVPTCGASRFALLTGRSPIRSGVTGGNAGLYQGKSALVRPQTPGAQSLPELFRRSGYYTSCIGKISHTADGKVYAYNGKGDGRDEVPFAWDELPTPYGKWKRGWGIFFAYEGGKHREDGNGHKDLMEFKAESDNDLPDGQLAQTAIERLKFLKTKKQAFFMGLGFFKPHLPFVATKSDWEAIDKTEVPTPAAAEKVKSPYWHSSGEFYKYAATHEKTRPLDREAQIKCRKAYLACVRYTDRQVGKVLKALDELGLAENTIVVVWGDHGWHLGDSAIWGKHSPFDRAVNSTLMIRAPGVSKKNLKSGALVETIDLYPTLVELCNPKFQKTEHPLDGRSLVPVLKGQKEQVRRSATSYWRNAISVRTMSHRLIAQKKKNTEPGQNPYSNVELYDVSRSLDPLENLATDSPKLVSELLQRMPKSPASKSPASKSTADKK